jgi:hypothetical protein
MLVLEECTTGGNFAVKIAPLNQLVCRPAVA